MRPLSIALTALFGASSCALLAQPYTPQDARNGAPVRAAAGVSIYFLKQSCPMPTSDQLRDWSASVNARYDGIKASIADQPLSIDLLIAEADHDYAMSLIDINCPDPADPATMELAATSLMAAHDALTQLETAIATAAVGGK